LAGYRELRESFSPTLFEKQMFFSSFLKKTFIFQNLQARSKPATTANPQNGGAMV
jgi:hypothetical protein